MIAPMSSTMVGDMFALARRAKVMSYIVASASLAYLVGSPIIGFIAGLVDWRAAFLGYLLPFAVLAFVLATVGVKPGPVRGSSSGQKYVEGFKVIFRSRSALSCLLGPSLSMTAWQVVLLYAASFFRQRYAVSLSFISIANIAFAGTFTAGSLAAGRIIDRIGRKKVTVLSASLAGVFIMIFMLIPDFLTANALCVIACLFAGIRMTASTSLALEQVLTYRGTMMSLYTATDQIGLAIGSGLGGALLLMYNYEALGLVLGALGIAGAGIMQALAVDPTRKERS